MGMIGEAFRDAGNSIQCICCISKSIFPFLRGVIADSCEGTKGSYIVEIFIIDFADIIGKWCAFGNSLALFFQGQCSAIIDTAGEVICAASRNISDRDTDIVLYELFLLYSKRK